jgi:radical SAM protein with 4Fe4S-binding SPASM domain
MRDIDFSYKTKAFLGILSKRAFAGPCIVVIASEYRCNQRCIFCKWFSPMAKVRNELASSNCIMNMDIYRGLVSELSLLGTKIILIGNNEEPFMDTQLLEKIECSKQYGLGCFVITNGSLLDEEKIEKLIDLKLDYLNVSLNAGTPQIYQQIHTTETAETFEKIVSMVSLIEKIKSKRQTNFPHTRLSMVVCNRNYRDIAKFVEVCQDTGVKNARIKRLISSSKEMAEKLELTPSQEEEAKNYMAEATKSAKKYCINLDMEWAEWTSAQKTEFKESLPCYYGWLFSVIDADGNVYPCCFQDNGASCSFGNIKEAGFGKVWFSKKYRDFRGQFKNIEQRRQMGYQCNQPACFFNNKQVYEILHKPYRYLSRI